MTKMLTLSKLLVSNNLLKVVCQNESIISYGFNLTMETVIVKHIGTN